MHPTHSTRAMQHSNFVTDLSLTVVGLTELPGSREEDVCFVQHNTAAFRPFLRVSPPKEQFQSVSVHFTQAMSEGYLCKRQASHTAGREQLCFAPSSKQQEVSILLSASLPPAPPVSPLSVPQWRHWGL